MSLLTRCANRVVKQLYPLFEHLGYHLIPINHASPIPVTKDLTDDHFSTTSQCVGLDWNRSVQERYLNEVFAKYAPELEPETGESPGLSLVDTAILHSMIRHHRPQKIVEIGSGYSTHITARACTMNDAEGHPSEFLTIDINPAESVKKGIPGLTQVVHQRAETIALDQVSDCDLLFIDSSHVVKIGGDVNYQILELVPLLKRGALVHWHDILLPGEYWEDWVKSDRYFWSEQYLLHAFLKFNSEFEIIWASRYMHLNQPKGISAVFPEFKPSGHRITSFWVRRKS